MKRIDMVPRPDWPQKMEELGFSFHSIDGIYWDERACYEFTATEVETLETATSELHEMCIEAAGHVIDNGNFERFAIHRSSARSLSAPGTTTKPRCSAALIFHGTAATVATTGRRCWSTTLTHRPH